jgi:hypothetical protein
MSWKDVIAALWNLIDSGPGIALLAAVLVYILNKVWAKKPAWRTFYEKYEGTLIAAVKQAEKLVDGSSEGSSGRKLEKALELVVEVLERVHGQDTVSKKEKAAITEALSKTHDNLERGGKL